MACVRCGAEVDRAAPELAVRLDLPPMCRACGATIHEITELAHRIAVDVMGMSARGTASLRVPFLLPARFEEVSFETYSCPPGNREAKDRAEAWRPNGGFGLYLHGPVGTGKTHLAAAIFQRYYRRWIPVPPKSWRVSVPQELKEHVSMELQEAYPRGVPIVAMDAIFVSMPEALAEVRRRIQEPDSRPESITRALGDCELLILDDLGAERTSDFAAEELYRVLERRIGEGRPLVVTSNCSPRDLAGNLDDPYQAQRIASRLAGSCEVVHVDCGDYRMRR